MDILFVTGFLGSGKTTFLKEYLRRHSGEKIGVIVNDFSNIAIDSERLKSVSKAVGAVSGGSLFCTCKQEDFLKKLKEFSHKPLSKVLVETSGFSNPANLLELMRTVKNTHRYRYLGMIALAAADTAEKVLHTNVAAKEQIRRADLLFVSKLDVVDQSFESIQELLKKENPLAPIYPVQHGQYEDGWIEALKPSLDRGNSTMDLSMQSIEARLDGAYDISDLTLLCEMIWPYVERIKGFCTLDGKSYFLNYTEEGLQIAPSEKTTSDDIVFLGRSPKMNRQKIQEMCKPYSFIVLRT